MRVNYLKQKVVVFNFVSILYSISAPGLDYGGWQPIGGEYGTPTSQPVYGDTPVLTADNTYSVSSNAAPPPLPSSGYPPGIVTIAILFPLRFVM